MALFNIFLENDDPNLSGQLANELPGDWANEFVHRSKAATDTDELNKRTNTEAVKKAFVKEEVEEFQTSVVLSKKILNIILKHPDCHGVRIALATNQMDKARNSFVITPVNKELKNITGDSSEKSNEGKDSLFEPEVVFYSENATGCPPRSGCN